MHREDIEQCIKDKTYHTFMDVTVNYKKVFMVEIQSWLFYDTYFVKYCVIIQFGRMTKL